jgi:hypothetical protein
MLFQQRVYVSVLLAGGNGDYALVSIGICRAIKLLAREEAHLNATGATIVDEALYTLIVPLARDAHVIEATRARLEGLADRMNAVDYHHVVWN